ncbi:MAG: hypothetical protein HY719_17380 [Planctomycetes bacterium]|nr:hypothetical protein [Planctomycetota bacterium]
MKHAFLLCGLVLAISLYGVPLTFASAEPASAAFSVINAGDDDEGEADEAGETEEEDEGAEADEAGGLEDVLESLLGEGLMDQLEKLVDSVKAALGLETDDDEAGEADDDEAGEEDEGAEAEGSGSESF